MTSKLLSHSGSRGAAQKRLTKTSTHENLMISFDPLPPAETMTPWTQRRRRSKLEERRQENNTKKINKSGAGLVTNAVEKIAEMSA